MLDIAPNALCTPTLMSTQSCITTIPNFFFQMRKTDPKRLTCLRSCSHLLNLSLSHFKAMLFSSPSCTACGILVTPPEIEPAPPALEVWGLNHWPAREAPEPCLNQERILRNNLVQFLFKKQSSNHMTHEPYIFSLVFTVSFVETCKISCMK